MKKILVVDDEPTLVATLKYNLEREGYQVFTAGDGESGLSAARDKRPDLIVLDLLLPIMDGLDVCRILDDIASAREGKQQETNKNQVSPFRKLKMSGER